MAVELATACAGAVGTARCAPCAWPGGWRPGSRPSGPTRHHERWERSPTICSGWPEHCCCDNASAQRSRAHQPLGAGSLPEPSGSSRSHHRSTGGKLGVATPTRVLSLHWGDRDTPDGSLYSLAAIAIRRGSGAAAGPRSDPAPAPHRPPEHERPDPHQDARSIVSNWHRARHDDDVHRMAIGDTNPDQTIEGSGETRPRRGRRPDDQSPSPEGPGP